MDNKRIWDSNWKQLGRYATHSAGSRWAFFLIRQVLKNVQLTPGTFIIDCGCGIGAKSELLAKLFPNNTVYGMDYSQQGIEFAKDYFNSIYNLFFYCSDVHDISYIDHSRIEMISAFELLEHIRDWEEYLAYLCEVSRKYILISAPTGRMRKYEKQLGHYRNYKKGEIEEFMEKHGYHSISVLYAGFPFWSPITRDVYNYINTSKNSQESGTGMKVSFNPILHSITYFVYRYLTFRRVGDQFVGLFKKT